ncbi:MAG TPA: hypothetical protein DCO77_00085 [Nitrospiraceae bacterium]|nr:hypothetical protein [Nitrospiraceae bacterium]
MKDYKNVTVPRKYRAQSSGTIVRRVNRGRRSRSRASKAAGTFLQFLSAMVLLGTLTLGWFGYQWFLHADVFRVAGVDVKGVRHLGEKDIRAMVSGFTGKNTFLVDLDDAARTARAHPWVKEARVYRSLPNRVSIVLTERVPRAVLDNGSGRYLLDDGGVVIEKIGRRGTPFPVVKIRARNVRVGERVAAEKMAETLAFLDTLSARGGWRMSDVVVKVDTPESLTVHYGGHTFRLGSGHYEEKLQRLSEVLSDVKRRGLTFAYVDLRSDRQVAVKIKR